MSEKEERPLLVWPIALIAFIIILIIIFVILTPLKTSFLNALGFEEKKEEKKDDLTPEEKVHRNLAQYNAFMSSFKSCIQLEETGCYCKSTNTYLSAQTIEFSNTASKLTVRLYDASDEDSCEVPYGRLLTEEAFEGKSIYFENTAYGLPDIEDLKIQLDDLIIAENVYLTKSKLCSTEPEEDIDFTKGVIYKIDKNKIALTRFQEELKICSSATKPNKLPEEPIDQPAL